MASYSSVQYVADNNLMVGIGENIFEPNANLTRGMFVTILGRMAGINAAAYTTSAFTDVQVGAWYRLLPQSAKAHRRCNFSVWR